MDRNNQGLTFIENKVAPELQLIPLIRFYQVVKLLKEHNELRYHRLTNVLSRFWDCQKCPRLTVVTWLYFIIPCLQSSQSHIRGHIFGKGPFSQAPWPSTAVNLLLLRFWSRLCSLCLRKSCATSECHQSYRFGGIILNFCFGRANFNPYLGLLSGHDPILLEHGLARCRFDNQSRFWWHCAQFSWWTGFCRSRLNSWGRWFPIFFFCNF